MNKLLILAALSVITPTWAANKCTASDGSVSFQDAPCPGNGRSESLKLPEVAPTTESEARINTALASGKVVAGMTSAQAKRAWGSPTKINSSVGRYGRNEQWVYERSDYRNYYLYMENGILTSFQTPE